MAVRNEEIAHALEQIADLLEIEGANTFRIRAYRNAARAVRDDPTPLADRVNAGENLAKLPGIGAGIAKKIVELCETGQIGYLEEIEGRLGRGLTELLRIRGLGPKRVNAIRDAFGVRSLEDLANIVEAGALAGLPGFGQKTAEAVAAAVRARTKRKQRVLWIEAEPVALDLLAWMRSVEGVEAIEIAGSFRRRRETVGDLDLLVSTGSPSAAVERFVAFAEVAEVHAKGTTRASVSLRSGLQVDLRVVPAESFGAALHYFTGSKDHNVTIRRMAQGQGLKVNEYGVFDGPRRTAGRTEKEVYAAVGLRYVEPELRENRGEIEAARTTLRKSALPQLVTVEDLKGDLHVHTDASDGRSSLREMVAAAQAFGHRYLAITDHTVSARQVNGLDQKRMRAQMAKIDALNEELRGFRVLKGAEVEILKDGSLDLPDDVLEELDLTVCSVHQPCGLSAAKQTDRVLRAMDHPAFRILAHPTGRLLNQHDPFPIEIERVIAGAAERGRFLEINGQPHRLDLDDVQARAAINAGVRLSLSSDAHSTTQLDHIRLAVGQARRGWVEKRHVLNALSLRDLLRILA